MNYCRHARQGFRNMMLRLFRRIFITVIALCFVFQGGLCACCKSESIAVLSSRMIPAHYNTDVSNITLMESNISLRDVSYVSDKRLHYTTDISRAWILYAFNDESATDFRLSPDYSDDYIALNVEDDQGSSLDQRIIKSLFYTPKAYRRPEYGACTMSCMAGGAIITPAILFAVSYALYIRQHKENSEAGNNIFIVLACIGVGVPLGAYLGNMLSKRICR